jgi:uncharacterized protein (DUF302 family)
LHIAAGAEDGYNAGAIMVTMTRDFSLSIKTTLEYQRALELLRQALQREKFRILAEVPFHREFEKNMGMSRANYTVLVVWSPFHAYRALLSDRDGGLLIPFNLLVAEHENSTIIAAINHLLFGRASGGIGVQALARDLNHQMRHIFTQIAAHEAKPDSSSLVEHRREAL